MAITLSQANAFNPGSDVWIVPAAEESHWTGQIDWYLNFQIGKTQRHPLPQIPETLTQIIQETELGCADIKAGVDTLLIAAQNHLPCSWLVVLPVKEDTPLWIENIYKTWKGLQAKSLRVFLPPNLSTATFQLAWKNRSEQDDLTLILD